MSRGAGNGAPVETGQPHTLRDYALLADGERGALVSPDGDITWMCFPDWASDAVFSSLIGGLGTYSVTPAGRWVWGGRYEPDTLIWRNRWVASDSIVECREALALPSSSDRAVLLRRVVALTGPARVHVRLGPRAGFGADPARGLSLRDDGCWTAEMDEVKVSWSGGAKATAEADGHRGRLLSLDLVLEEGDHHDLVLVLATGGADPEPPDPEWAWEGVEAEWSTRVPNLERTVAPRDSRHAYAVLSGLTSGGGGMVAAATTSLPERARQGRNYDYRYAWIRDQCYTGTAAARAGALPLLDAAVGFVGARLLDDGEHLKPAYTTAGGRVPDQRQLDLPGYPGGSDIVGNWVNEQFQLDAFGEALLLFAAAADGNRLDADGWGAAEAAATAIEKRWREHGVDAGIWEIEPDEWAQSRLSCAAGLRAIARHSPGRERAAAWVALADRIVADTAAESLHPSGRWQRSPTDPRPDASLLLAAVRGAVDPSDPRSLATLAAVEAELTQDGFCYRYRPDERPLGESEGAFLLCGFFMALALAQQGREVEAARWFERNRAACGPPGLLSEEFDVAQRQLRGNLPQAFVHALMLECAAGQYDPRAAESGVD